KLLFLAPPINDHRDDHNGPEYGEGDSEWSGKFLDTFAEIICSEPVEQRPNDRTRAVGNHEFCKAHPVCPSDEPDHRAQHGHEASNEHYQHSLTSKQILGNFDPSFGQSNVGTVAKQQRIPEPIADPKADDAAEYRPRHCGKKNESNTNALRRSRENR